MMDVIVERAKKFAKVYVRNYNDSDNISSKIYSELLNINNPGDKVKFIQTILEKANNDLIDHKLGCKKENCGYDFGVENIKYNLNQELEDLGVVLNEDTFTFEEKSSVDEKLDKILKDLNEVKLGQEMIYDDLKEEIEQLRNLLFLGKKKWHQLFLGFVVEKTTEDIFSATVSSEILKIMSENSDKILALLKPG
ncbi:MAG: hypothetical protein KBF75_11695 [Saprospiraceae bacterium]|nr:hypothetical protein [Saprospiraceae bacterium]